MREHKIVKVSIRRLIDIKYRIYWLLMIVLVFGLIASKNFLTVYNMTSILKGSSLGIFMAIGFTLVLIIGQLDLSIASNAALGGICAIGLQPTYGWLVGTLVGIILGAIVGLFNGILVTRAKIHSFIATLASMTIVGGILDVLTAGGTISTNSLGFGDWLEHQITPLLTPRVIVAVVLVIVAEVFLTKTRLGKGFYVVGANKESAFLAGLNTEGYTIGAFILSGIVCSAGGALYAASLGSAVSTMGSDQLMAVIAATIIGGTSMAGGIGSIVRSMVAVIMMLSLYNGLSLYGVGIGVQVMINGLVLAVIVFQEVYLIHHQNLVRGQRRYLVDELLNLKKG